MIAHNCQEGCDHRRAQELERMWRNRLIYTVLVVQPLRKEDNMEIPAELKTELMCNHQHHCWVFIQKSWDQDHKAMPTFSIDHLSAPQTVARPHIHRHKSMIEKIRRHLAGWPFLWHKAGLGPLSKWTIIATIVLTYIIYSMGPYLMPSSPFVIF